MGVEIDITGHRYNRLTVLGKSGDYRGDRPLWLCLCDCGEETQALSNSLRGNNTRSCGCFKLERVKKMGLENRKHGDTGSSEYSSWANMQQRCYNPSDKDFEHYGARGYGS